MKKLLTFIVFTNVSIVYKINAERTTFAKEAASPLIKYIEIKKDGPCSPIWNQYKEELGKYGFVSDSAAKLYDEFLVCEKRSLKENSARFEKTKEQEDAIQRFKEKNSKIIK